MTFKKLHERILGGLQAADGGAFEVDAWERPGTDGRLAGEGKTCVLEGGKVFERAGVNYSDVRGPALPPSATQKHPEAAGKPFRAMGVSVVVHPLNPWVPTSHFNVRMIRAGEQWWFGGGFDLTPYLPIEEDARHWHEQAAIACETLSPMAYGEYKKRCDEYFYLPHRDEARGVGGIFFDDLDHHSQPIAADETQCAVFVDRLATAYLDAYLPIVEKRRDTPFAEAQRQFQLYRRGRYVEFNLVIDRGTHFGLQSKGRIDSILVSMPPLASWSYRPPDEAMAKTLGEFLQPRDWR